MVKVPRPDDEQFIEMSLSRLLSDRFARYSKYIIQERAIPDVRDGLKPVQRRILYAMYDLRLFFDSPYKKSARIVGEVIGKYHPHGDSSIYDALIRMSQNWKMNLPLIQMHGNNGSVDDDPAAAMRYTEARLSRVAQHMLRNLKKDTVEFAPNFDDSELEPTVLPGSFPNLLVNGTSGIAAGYATEMPPHNLNEVLDAIIYCVENPRCKPEDLVRIVRGPDFPTGGIVENDAGLQQALRTGRGRITIRSNFEIVEHKTTPFMVIKEIPYGVVKSKLVKSIDDIIYSKRIYGLKEVRDESDKTGIRVVIDLTSDANFAQITNYLLQKTEMQVYYNYNNTCIYKKTPQVLPLKKLLETYIEYRKYVILRYKKFDLVKSQNRLEIVLGLLKASEISQKIIQVIQRSKGSRAGVVKNLVQEFQFTETQAGAIADLRLYRLSSTDQSVYQDEAKQLTNTIAKLQHLIASDATLNNYLTKQILQIKEDFYTERRTQITSNTLELKIDEKSLIKDEQTNIAISYFGYAKRYSPRILETNTLADYKTKENDYLIHNVATNSRNHTLIFTRTGNFALIPNYKFGEEKWRSVGTHVNNVTKLSENARIVAAIDVADINLPLYVCMITRTGMTKRVRLRDFASTRYFKPIIAINIKKDDELVDVVLSTGHERLVIVTRKGKVNKYHEQEVQYMSTKAGGVRGINLSKGDEVAALAVARNDEDIVITFNTGYYTLLKVADILTKHRLSNGYVPFQGLSVNSVKFVQCARVVNPDTRLIFVDHATTKYYDSVSFRKNAEYGIMKKATKCNHSFVLVPQRASTENPYLQNRIEDATHDDEFANAEEKLKKSQMSIDDILKDM